MKNLKNVKLFISVLLAFAMLLPVMMPIGAAEADGNNIYFEDEVYPLTVAPSEGSFGVEVCANDLASAFSMEVDFDAEAKSFTVFSDKHGKVVLMHRATEFYSGNNIFSCLPYFHVENGMPMVDVGFFCEMFDCSFDYNSSNGNIYISRGRVYEETSEVAAPFSMRATSSSISVTVTYADGAPEGGIEARMVLATRSTRINVYGQEENAMVYTVIGSTYIPEGETTVQYNYDVSEYKGLVDYYHLYCEVPEFEYCGYADVSGETTQTRYYPNYRNRYPTENAMQFLFNEESTFAFAVEVPDITFDYDGETLTVSGEGDLFAVPGEYQEATCLIINEGITGIGEDAFYDFYNLESVALPSSVTYIGNWAFVNCYNLTEVVFSEGLVTIGGEAFAYCEALTSIVLPSSLVTIDYNAFYGCYNLTSVTIPASVTTIGNQAFFSCTSLTSITVDSNNPIYSSDEYGVLFNKDKTELIQFPMGSEITEYTVPDGVEIVSEYAFDSCENLTSVTISESVTTIGDYAFYYCRRLTSITIPESVTTIGDYAFRYCRSLTSINVDRNNPIYSSDEYGVLFNKDKTELIQFPMGSEITEYTVPDSVEIVSEHAFDSCENLTSVTIPESVTNIGYYAFYYCTSLTSITIPESVTTIGIGAFYDCDYLTIYGKHYSYAKEYANEYDIPFVPYATNDAVDSITALVLEFYEDDVNTVILSNGWQIRAVDIGVGANTPKYSYLGLPITLYLNCAAEDFETLYANGDADIIYFDRANVEVETVNNIGESANIRYLADTNKLMLGENSFLLSEYELELFVFGSDGWTAVAESEKSAILNNFAYSDGRYTGDPSTCNTYGEMSYFVETDGGKKTVEIFYIPYEFGQYIERDFRYAATAQIETFKIIGTYTGEEYKTVDRNTTWFEEKLLGSNYTISSSMTTVSKRLGQASFEATVNGEGISSGEFMFYYYNPLDNILTVAKNCGELKIGRLTGVNTVKQTYKIDGNNYYVGFAEPYPAIVEFDPDFAQKLYMRPGEKNIQYITIDDRVVFCAEYIDSSLVEQTLVLLSTRPAIMAELLGISVEEYNDNLYSGFYLADGYIAVASFNFVTCEWELAYIENVATEYDDTFFEFTQTIDVTELIFWIKIAGYDRLAETKRADFDTARTIFGWEYVLGELVPDASGCIKEGLYILAEADGNVFTVADVNTVDSNGEYIVGRGECSSLQFSAAGLTNKIGVDTDDLCRVQTADETSIVAITPDGVEFYKGVASSRQNINETVTFFAANCPLILFTTDANLIGWNKPEDYYKQYYVVMPEFNYEVNTTDEDGIFEIVVEDLFNITLGSLGSDIVSFTCTWETFEEFFNAFNTFKPGDIIYFDENDMPRLAEEQDITIGVLKDGYSKVSVDSFEDAHTIGIPELGIVPEVAISGINATVLTLNLSSVWFDEIDWGMSYTNIKYNEENPVEFDGHAADDYGSGEYYYEAYLDTEEQIEIGAPECGIFCDFDIYASKQGYTIAFMCDWDGEYRYADVKFSYAAKYDEYSDTVELIIFKTLTDHECYGEWVVDTPATETTIGEKHRVCKGCEAIETEIIPIIIQNDFSGDGILDIADAVILIEAALNDTTNEATDINGDGKTNLIDILRLIKSIIT